MLYRNIKTSNKLEVIKNTKSYTTVKAQVVGTANIIN